MICEPRPCSSGLYAALTFHHARLETSLRHVIATLHLEGTGSAEACFEAFHRELFALLEAEETWLLPPYEGARPRAAEIVREQHAKLRAAAALAAEALAASVVDERPLHELDQLLAEHCRSEESDLYRWSETAIGQQASRAVLQKIEAVELEEECRGAQPS
jgi:hypothetical protein